MRLLIDSNVFLWTAFDPSQLSSRARAAVEDPDNTLVVSTITPLELALAASKGRLALGDSVEGFFRDHMDDLEAEELPFAMQHAFSTIRFSYTLRDPMDRALAGQASWEGLPMITRDRVIPTLGIQVVW